MSKCTQRNQFIKATSLEIINFQKKLKQKQFFRQIIHSLYFLHKKILSFNNKVLPILQLFILQILIIKKSFIQELQLRKVSNVINNHSPDTKQLPDVNKKNMSIYNVGINPKTERYKIHLDLIENQNPIQIPHLSFKTPQKYPPILASKILPSARRYKTEISESTQQQIYKISNHFTIQSVKDRQYKLVKNIQSLIEQVNSSRDEKLCKLFDKLKHDLNLHDIKLENE